MKTKIKRGFTLIEVSLFLAITGLLFLGVTVGVQNSIFQQRFNDSVQGFAEFLRSVYTGVLNTQSLGAGDTESAIYGKLVTFGESIDLNDCPVNGGIGLSDGCVGSKDDNAIFVYDVIGGIGEVDSGKSPIEMLLGWNNGGSDSSSGLNADIVTIENDEVIPVGVVEDFRPRWGARIESTSANGGIESIFKGALLIIRHPSSGVVNTYVVEGSALQVNQNVSDMNSGTESKNTNVLRTYWNANRDSFKLVGHGESVDLCVNPAEGEYNARADVRIVGAARNASAIEIIMDSSSNKCRT